MRPNLTLRPPVVIDAAPLPPLELRQLRTAFLVRRVPPPPVTSTRLIVPAVVAVVVRVAHAVRTVARWVSDRRPRRPTVLTVEGARPPPDRMDV